MRRVWMVCAAVVGAGVGGGGASAQQVAPPAVVWEKNAALPISGEPSPGLEALDALLERFVREQQVPGATVAVSHEGRLVYARGFGVLDTFVDPPEPVLPSTRMRIAGVSNLLTAVAALSLVEEGRLGLEEAMAAYWQPEPVEGAAVDPRMARVRVLDLLQQSSGFSDGMQGPSFFQHRQVSEAVGRVETLPPALEGEEPRQRALPPTAGDVLRVYASQPLAFEPGSTWAYSDANSLALGRVIEGLTGEGYEAFVRERVLRPAGAAGMSIGGSGLDAREAGESGYHSQQAMPLLVSNDAALLGGMVPACDGGWSMEALDAAGGWIATAEELVLVVDALDAGKLLKRETVARMISPPPFANAGTPVYYALGWWVKRSAGQPTDWYSYGSLQGSAGLVLRRDDGVNVAVLLNRENLFDPPALPARLERDLSRVLDGVDWARVAAGAAKE